MGNENDWKVQFSISSVRIVIICSMVVCFYPDGTDGFEALSQEKHPPQDNPLVK